MCRACFVVWRESLPFCKTLLEWSVFWSTSGVIGQVHPLGCYFQLFPTFPKYLKQQQRKARAILFIFPLFWFYTKSLIINYLEMASLLSFSEKREEKATAIWKANPFLNWRTVFQCCNWCRELLTSSHYCKTTNLVVVISLVVVV